MSFECEIVKAVDPRSSRYRWAVSSHGGQDAYVRIACIDCAVSTPEDPLGKLLAEIKIPRDVASMVAMAVLYDQMRSEGKLEDGDPGAGAVG